MKKSTLHLFGLETQRFNYYIEFQLSIISLIQKLYLLNFWQIMATTVNLLMFMFYLQLRLFKNQALAGLPQLPPFSDLILTPWAPFQYIIMTLGCAFF